MNWDEIEISDINVDQIEQVKPIEKIDNKITLDEFVIKLSKNSAYRTFASIYSIKNKDYNHHRYTSNKWMDILSTVVDPKAVRKSFESAWSFIFLIIVKDLKSNQVEECLSELCKIVRKIKKGK